MILLDTNVVSELIRPQPAEQVVAWLDAQQSWTLWLPSVALAELTLGVALLPGGKRKRELALRVDTMVAQYFPDRVAPFDADAAGIFGELVAQRQCVGRPIPTADAQIAAICLSRNASLATRNVADFEGTGVDVVNPWQT